MCMKPWRRIRRCAGLEGVRIHDLRHTFAATAAGLGLGLPIVGSLLGHAQPSTTQRYAHVAWDPVKAATDQIGDALAAMMEGSHTEPLGNKASLSEVSDRSDTVASITGT